MKPHPFPKMAPERGPSAASWRRRHGTPLRAFSAALILLLLALPFPARAQWSKQTVPLKPGWNAVFLEVHPQPEDCDALFAGLPVESVWDFNRSVDAPQFVQDPTALIPGAPGWLTWFPTNH